MNARRKIEYITPEEYAELEQFSQIKHEYFDGQIYAMAGASTLHSRLAGNTYASLHRQLRGRGCIPLGSDQRIKIEATGKQTYPDVLVACPPLRYEGNKTLVLLDATVIVEVLSPSTTDYERSAKHLDFQLLPSLRHYVLVSQDSITVDHRWRADDGDWKTEVFVRPGDAVRLSAIDCTLALADIYEGLDIDPNVSLMPPSDNLA